MRRGRHRRAAQGSADKYKWQPVYEGDKIIALVEGMASITLEPGGQFELSGAPLEHIHQTCSAVGQHLTQLRDVAGGLGIEFLGLGNEPEMVVAETPIMPRAATRSCAIYMAEGSAGSGIR